ncbi:putative carboxylesterase [Actinoplanes missouriensis 431]|uniref:Putative carboxylesterase n=1 Tax=Actinoplanes missouriensis (strain ATCC 14538 / DSM 43046 / CBS 188.64 / JCM 3121 / NBRC 102363 / NCIMB 12654 / NRRL B-3342 / UNCC 431) TaxID=512565 RepID=I0HBA0_ACTM4|nr:serine hydrolase domain-containing protein [Actinoplanes missouriensis]BAL90287.1 putative carboxylesterase [Actinoplanes missouriensis 431]
MITEPAFAGVRRAFDENFAAGDEVGAAVCVYHRGRPVVDLWDGHADAERTDPWRPDTLAVLASPTKALVTGALLHLAERGVVDLDAPIARYWPEFAAHGKDRVTARMVLAQRSGVVCLDHDPITPEHLRAHTPIARALAAARPEWEPDTAFAYHAATYGHLVSEIIRRRTGRTVGEYFAREIAAPLGLDCHIGLPDPGAAHLAAMLESRAEQLMDGAAPGDENPLLVALGDKSSLTYRASVGTMALPDALDPSVEDPSYGGLASAQSLARYFASFLGPVGGFRLVGPATVARIRRVHSQGTCLITRLPAAWGLGMQVADSPVFPAAAGLGGAFGFDGANGVFTFADPDHELAFAYVRNAGSATVGRISDRARRLVEAVYASAGADTGDHDREVRPR